MFIFGLQVDNDRLYRGIENRHSLIYSSLYLSIFLLSTFFVKDISTTINDRNWFIFGKKNTNDKLYRGIDNCPVCFSLYLLSFRSAQCCNFS